MRQDPDDSSLVTGGDPFASQKAAPLPAGVRMIGAECSYVVPGLNRDDIDRAIVGDDQATWVDPDAADYNQAPTFYQAVQELYEGEQQGWNAWREALRRLVVYEPTIQQIGTASPLNPSDFDKHMGDGDAQRRIKKDLVLRLLHLVPEMQRRELRRQEAEYEALRAELTRRTNRENISGNHNFAQNWWLGGTSFQALVDIRFRELDGLGHPQSMFFATAQDYQVTIPGIPEKQLSELHTQVAQINEVPWGLHLKDILKEDTDGPEYEDKLVGYASRLSDQMNGRQILSDASVVGDTRRALIALLEHAVSIGKVIPNGRILLTCRLLNESDIGRYSPILQ